MKKVNGVQKATVNTRNGLGEAPADLQGMLAQKLLSLINETSLMPAKILFYTGGVKLACTGSPIIDQPKQLESRGVELILCKTCLDYFRLVDKVEVGIVGDMPDIIEAMAKAEKVISL